MIFLSLFICSEENAYLLCKKLCTDGIAEADGSDLFVVFISNEKKQACIFMQHSFSYSSHGRVALIFSI